MEYTQVGAWALDPWVEATLKELGHSTAAQITCSLNTQYDMLLSTNAIAASCRRLEAGGKVIVHRTHAGVKYNMVGAAPQQTVAEKLEPILREIIAENPWIYVKKLTELLAEKGMDISPTQVGAALNSYDWVVKGRTNLGVVVATDTALPKVQERKHVEPKPHISMLDLLNTQELELAVMDICENGRITPTELLNSLIAEGHKELNPTILGLILKSYDWLAKKRTSRGYILYAR